MRKNAEKSTLGISVAQIIFVTDNKDNTFNLAYIYISGSVFLIPGPYFPVLLELFYTTML